MIFRGEKSLLHRHSDKNDLKDRSNIATRELQLCNSEKRKKRERREEKKRNPATQKQGTIWGSAEPLSAVFELQAKMAAGSSRDSGRGYISRGRSCRPACGVRTVKEVGRVLVVTARERKWEHLDGLSSLPPFGIGRTLTIFIDSILMIWILYCPFCNSLYHGPENHIDYRAHASFSPKHRIQNEALCIAVSRCCIGCSRCSACAPDCSRPRPRWWVFPAFFCVLFF